MTLKFKEHQQISKYIPDYAESQLPEKDYYHKIVCSLYSHMMDVLIFLAYGKKGVSAEAQNAEKIELTSELTEEIKSIVELPNKFN